MERTNSELGTHHLPARYFLPRQAKFEGVKITMTHFGERSRERNKRQFDVRASPAIINLP